jgi:hypothetical protein
MWTRWSLVAALMVAGMTGLAQADGVMVLSPQANPSTSTQSPQENPGPVPSPSAHLAMAPTQKFPDACIARRCIVLWEALGEFRSSLTDEAKAKVNAALVAWAAAYDAKFAAIEKQYWEVAKQARTESDPATKAQLSQQAADLLAQIPTRVQNYASIREALAGAMTAEQLTMVDTAARTCITNGVLRNVEMFFATMGATLAKAEPPAPLTDDQKEKVKQLLAKTKEAANKLPLGTAGEDKAFGDILAAANQEFIKDILTDQQRAAFPSSNPRR